MRTLDEAIKSEELIVEDCEEQASMCDMNNLYERNVAFENGKCAERHREIIEWLKELKRLREKEDVLDNIEEEIEQLPTILVEVQRPHSVVSRDVVELGLVLNVIDKYKVESED